MRVLLVDVNYGQGSTGSLVQALFHALKSRGHDAVACYGRGSQTTESGVYKFGIDSETYIHAALTRISGYTGCFSYFSTKKLIKIIDEYKPDVIHLHELHAYFVSLAPLLEYIKSRKISIVWTFHCEFMYTGKCGHAYECKGFTRYCGDCPQLGEYISTFWFDKTRQMLAEKKRLLDSLNMTIVTPSQWLARRVEQSFLADRPIRVIQNGIDIDIFKPRDTTILRNELNIPDAHKIVLALAPNLMSDLKGGKSVLELARRFRGEPVVFVLVGVDDSAKYEVMNNVIMIPATHDKTFVSEYYSLADVFLICSERENYPTTCLEAQACGTPVVGFDVGGVSETIVNGEVVGYGDLSALKKALVHQLEENKSRSLDGCSAYFDKENCIREYLSLYEEIGRQQKNE